MTNQLPPSGAVFLDNVAHFVPEMDAAAAALQHCGFRLTPFTAQTNRVDGQPVPAGTGNRCELAIGYFTKHGDGACDLMPLGRLLKSEVRALAREIGVPAAIVDRTSSAGLWMGQTDEQEIGFSYADLERYLEEGPQAVSPALAMRIERLIRSTEHKRSLPPMPDD